MNLKNLTPWNWFRKEDDGSAGYLAAARHDDPFAHMHREMDRMFEDFFGRGARPGAGLMLRPSVDIGESKTAYKISVEVPGIEADDIDVQVAGDTLVVSGEKRRDVEDDDQGFHRVERSYGRFRRVLTLPDDADSERIKAEFDNGVLRIRVPRLEADEAAGARRIDIGR